MPACASRHAGTLCQPRGFCCLPVNGLFRGAAGSAALLIFLLMLILKMLPYYFLCFLPLCPHSTSGTGISGIGIYISVLEASRTASGCPFLSGAPCLFVQLAGLASDIAKGALLFSLSASVFFSATHRASDFRHTKMPQASACGIFLEVPTRFELVHRGFADLCLTTWLRHHMQIPPP